MKVIKKIKIEFKYEYIINLLIINISLKRFKERGAEKFEVEIKNHHNVIEG